MTGLGIIERCEFVIRKNMHFFNTSKTKNIGDVKISRSKEHLEKIIILHPSKALLTLVYFVYKPITVPPYFNSFCI